jgi:hypothetical protein
MRCGKGKPSYDQPGVRTSGCGLRYGPKYGSFEDGGPRVKTTTRYVGSGADIPTPFGKAQWLRFATCVEVCNRKLDPFPPWQSAPDMSAWLARLIHGQNVSAGTDTLALDEAAASVAFNRHEPLDALTAAQVRDLHLFEACAHPEPNGQG